MTEAKRLKAVVRELRMESKLTKKSRALLEEGDLLAKRLDPLSSLVVDYTAVCLNLYPFDVTHF
jgi:hypothetical protein